MADLMQFPKTWEEFEASYGFSDSEEVYTNGARLIPSFRVKQWLEHIDLKHGKWELVGSVSMCDPFGELAWGKMFRCSECGFVRRFIIDSEHYKFCPNCGARMDDE